MTFEEAERKIIALKKADDQMTKKKTTRGRCVICGNLLPPGRRVLCSEECKISRTRQRNKENAAAWWPTRDKKMVVVTAKCPLCEAVWKTKMNKQPRVMPRIYCNRCRTYVSQF